MNAEKTNDLSLRAKRSNPHRTTDAYAASSHRSTAPLRDSAHDAPRNDRWTILLIIIVLFAFALRVWDIGGLRMWGDEGFSVYSANRDLYAITFEGKDVDPHPPLYYYLLHFYLPIGGYSEFSIRFFSVLFGTATVALVYAIGKRMFGERVGALAATILALAPFAVHYSQEVRMYALVMFLGALATWFFWQIADGELLIADSRWQIANGLTTSHKQSAIRYLLFAVSMLLAQYSLYQAAFVFVAQGIFLAPFLKRRFGFVMRWLAVSLAVVFLFIPWLVAHSGSALTDIQGVAGDTTPMNVFEFLSRGFAAISVGTSIPISNAFMLAALFLAVIIIGLAIAFVTRKANINDWLLVAFVAIPMIAYYPVYLAAPLYRGRLFALALVPLMLLLARSTQLIVQRARVMAIPLSILIVGVSAYSLNDYYFRFDRYSAVVEDYLPAIHDIEQRAQPGDVVLFHAYWQEGYFLSHYRGTPITYGLVDKQPDLNDAVSKSRNAWAIIQALSHHGAEDWFVQNAAFLGEKDYGQMRVLAYRAGTPAIGETFASPVTLDNGMSLLGYHVNGDTPLESGRGSVILQLDWQATQNIASDYIVSVRVTNNAGNIVWAQTDNPPTNGSVPTSKWQAGQTIKDYQTIPIPPGTPPGAYRVRIVVYESSNRRVANIVAPEDQRGQSIATGSISVSRSAETTIPITPTVPLTATWNEIALIGSEGTPQEINAGDTLPLTLYWQAKQKPLRDYFVHALVLDSAGTLRASDIHRPASSNFPTNAWSTGETWVDKFNLTIDATSLPGPAQVFIFLGDETSNERGIQIASIKINAREHRFALPSPKQSLTATLGGKIKLLGYDLDAIKSGTPISLTLYWQAIESMNERYAVFIHVLDSSGKLVAQRDSEPIGGTAPTTSWLRNEVIVDPYQIDLPRNLAPGNYRLMVGMYSLTQSKRFIIDETKLDYMPIADFKIAPR